MPIFPHQDITIGQPEPLSTPEAQRALTQLNAIRRDPKHPVNDPKHPGYEAAWEALRPLYRAVYGAQGTKKI